MDLETNRTVNRLREYLRRADLAKDIVAMRILQERLDAIYQQNRLIHRQNRLLKRTKNV